MTNFNMKALVAALIAANASMVCASDELVPGGGGAGAPAVAGREDDGGAAGAGSSSPVTVKKPSMKWEEYPVDSAKMQDWLNAFRVPGAPALKARKSVPLRSAFVSALSGELGYYNIPRGSDGRSFGMSFPWKIDSNIYAEALRFIHRRRTATPKVLNLGAGHAFFDISLFLMNLSLECHSMDLSRELTDIYNRSLKPIFNQADAAKSSRFTYVQGNAADGRHPLFHAGEYDLITAFNLLHYLPSGMINNVLRNIHGSLAHDGQAIFVLSSGGKHGRSDIDKYELPKVLRKKTLVLKEREPLVAQEEVRESDIGRLYEEKDITTKDKGLLEILRHFIDFGGNAASAMANFRKKNISGTFVDQVPARLFSREDVEALLKRNGLFEIVSLGGLDNDGKKEENPRASSSVYVIVKPRGDARGSGAGAGVSVSATATAVESEPE